MNHESALFLSDPLEVDPMSRLAGFCGTRASDTTTLLHYDMTLLTRMLPLSIARRFRTTARPCSPRFPLNTTMPQIGDQPPSRTGLRRQTSNDAISSTKGHQGFVKKTIEVVVMAFMIMTVVLFLALTFLRYAPKMAAADGSDGHHFAGKGKRFTMYIFVSPSPSPPFMQLRGSRKRANRESRSGSGESELKDRLNSLEGNEGVEIDIIAQQATDAASKASQAAVEAGIAAVAAVVEETTISAGAASEGGPWGVSLTTME